MTYLTFALRSFLFLVLFLFALKNHEPVTLKFYFDLEWRAPLILLLLTFFVCGIVVGLAALLPGVMRRRREISALTSAQGLLKPAHSVPSPPRDAVP